MLALDFFRDASPSDMSAALAKMSELLAARAEAVYLEDPEENGPKAQPFADASQALRTAADAFHEDAPAAVDAEAVADVGSPTQRLPRAWAGR